jgi:hypothetical protein
VNTSSKRTTLLLTSVAFLLGAAVGWLAALYAVPEGQMLSFMRGYAAAYAAPDLRQALLGNFLAPALVFLLGLTLPGVVLIPAVVAGRGFFLSFAVAVYARVFGLPGILLAFGAVGLPGLLTVPCLFALAVFGFAFSRRLLLKSAGGTRQDAENLLNASYVRRFALTLPPLAAAACYDVWLSGYVWALCKPM